MAAFSRAIRAHRLLAKLAPRLFDFAVVDRESAAHREELDRRRFLQPILNKVYGLPADTPLDGPCHPPDSRVPKNDRTRQAMEREYACWQLWMSTGHHHMDSFQRGLPHARIALKRLARLLSLGSTFARLATGRGGK